ncbi:MAG TPA: alpha/beta fold hydrolase [Phycicoccus sp.]|nr:alpha/beta fold hydrolase [Phycicoccus sp.]
MPDRSGSRPGDGRSLAVRRDGMRLEARDAGPRGGEVVVLLHGFPQDRTCWDTVAPLLGAAGLRTVAPDQRGYGGSDRPSGVSPYRVEELVADVLAVADATGSERIHVVGHDWGGVVAWEVAARHPDRVATVTVLSTPHPSAYVWSLLRSRQPLMSWYTLAVQLPVLPELVLSATLAPVLVGSGLPPDLAERYASRVSGPGDLGPMLAWYRAVARRAPRPWSVGTPDVRVPTTYVWGRHDPALGRAAAERTAHHVTGRYRFVELDAGHWLPELHPSEVAEAVLDRIATP